MLTAEFDADINATLSPLLKLNVKQVLAGTSNPVLVLTTGVAPNAINAGLAPLEIAIRLDVIAVLVLTAPAVNVTV
jgi:hypothetical protein